MADLVANVTEFDDVTKINAKESSSKLEEYFIGTLEKGVKVKKKRPLNVLYRIVLQNMYLVTKRMRPPKSLKVRG